MVYGKVTDNDGHPIPDASVQVWQTSEHGLYDLQADNAADMMDLRANFRTDGSGHYHFRTVRPLGYSIPMDGPVGEMVQSDQGQRAPKSAALLARIDTEHIHLAQTRAVRVHFGPVKARQLAGAFVDREEQPGRVEPGLRSSLGDIVARQPALLRVPRERGVVDSQQLGVVGGATVGAHV